MSDSGRSLMVLGWHNVEATSCFPAAPGRGPRGLHQQLRALRALTNVVPLGRALRAISEGRPLPPRALAITFDDGYRDNLTIAGPMLHALGLPATCFLVPGILSREVVPWWERLAWAFVNARADHLDWRGQRLSMGTGTERQIAFRLVAEPLKEHDRLQREVVLDELESALSPPGEYRTGEEFLDWDGARELRQYMEIGSHSQYHAILARETVQDQHTDLLGSRRRLCDELDLDVSVLAYPNGHRRDYDDHTTAASERAGYTHAITTDPGWNTRSTPRYEIRRWLIHPDRGVRDLAKIVRDLRMRFRKN